MEGGIYCPKMTQLLVDIAREWLAQAAPENGLALAGWLGVNARRVIRAVYPKRAWRRVGVCLQLGLLVTSQLVDKRALSCGGLHGFVAFVRGGRGIGRPAPCALYFQSGLHTNVS